VECQGWRAYTEHVVYQGRSKIVERLPVFPIIIGVTGHRTIAPEAEAPIRAAVHALLEDWKAWFDPALYVLTALADGADQIVADEAGKLHIPTIAVAPMPLPEYRRTLRDPAAFDEHWRHATLRLILPEIAGPDQADYRDRHYEQLGILLARRSHLLLALWDGTSQPTGGGTGAVVRMRLNGDHGAAAFAGSPMFRDADSLLKLTNQGPVLQIVTPRAGHPTDGAGDCVLLDRPEQNPSSKATIEPDKVFGSLGKRLMEDFQRIRALNGQIASFSRSDWRLLEQQLGYIQTGGAPPPVLDNVEFLKRLQSAADTAAQIYQGRLMGHFVPETSLRRMINRASAMRRNTGHRPRLGVVFFFAAAVPVAVVAFEVYAHLGGGLLALLIYLVVFGGVATYHRLRLSDHMWQNCFQDYRALAEAMRVQLYWALAAVPAAVSDHYLNKQSNELGWIQLALRGPSLWAAAVAQQLDGPCGDIVKTGWLNDQLSYFRSKAPLHERANREGRTWARRFLYGGLIVSVALLLHEAWPMMTSGKPGIVAALWELFHPYHHYVDVIAVTLPALAAFFSVSRELRVYERHAHSYSLMTSMFSRAISEFNKATLIGDAHRRAEAIQQLVRELGREALAENAEWLVDHRHRSFDTDLFVDTPEGVVLEEAAEPIEQPA